MTDTHESEIGLNGSLRSELIALKRSVISVHIMIIHQLTVNSTLDNVHCKIEEKTHNRLEYQKFLQTKTDLDLIKELRGHIEDCMKSFGVRIYIIWNFRYLN